MEYKSLLNSAILVILLAPISATHARINELRLAGDRGYFEIRGPAGLDVSSFHYVVIGDAEDEDSGVIETVIPLQGVVPEDGFYLAAGPSFRATNGNVDFVTDLPFEQDDNVTHLVVGGFTGAVGMDLDKNDDCMIDMAVPWGRVIDGVALVKEPNPPQSTECHYGGDALGEGLNFPVLGLGEKKVPNQVFAVPDGSNNYRSGTGTPGDQNDFYVHDNFSDGQIDDFSPVSWSAGGGLSIEEDGLNFIRADAAGVRASTESGDLPARGDWSLRARITLNDFSGPGFAGVGVNGARWASIFGRDGAFGVGELFETTTVFNQDTKDIAGEEFVVQLRATSSKLEGHFWLPDSPGAFISVERSNNAGGTFEPRLINNGADETFHEVWVSTEPLPLPVPGTSLFADANGDRELDSGDIDYLSELVRGGSDRPVYDLDSNGMLDQEDRRVWVEDAFGTVFGDANLDGKVGFDDFLKLSESFGLPGGWSDGDFDGSGQIQFPDFLLLAENFGETTVAASVPEPSGILYAILGIGVLASVRRKLRL